jgi:amino acid transporter
VSTSGQLAPEVSLTKQLSTEGSSEGLKRDASFLGLLFTSEGSIIGSGWLFGALFVSVIGGPAAIIAWLIGSFAVILLAFVHAELGGLFPVSGGTARFPYYAFGGLAGASFGWFSWLQAVGTAPIEVEAAIQYSSNYIHGLSHTVNGVVVLTGLGYLVAVGLMALFTVINLYGVRRLIQANNAITTWKVVIPTLTIIVLFFTHFSTANFTSHGFAPYGTKGVLEAVSAGGAIFSLLGFEQAVQLGGESRNPQRDLPRAVIGSILIGATIYILLQVVFIGALPASALRHGWADLNFTGIFGPFAGIAKGLGLGWLAYILYADAIIAPVGTGLVYTTTSSRLTFGLSKNGNVPVIFEKTNRTGVPWFGLVFAFLMGLILFLPFRGWQTLVGFITSATVLMYAGAPLALGALRRQKPDLPRPFRLRAAGFWAPVAFIAANLIIYWSGWEVIWKLDVAIFLGYVLMGVSRLTHANPAEGPLDWASAIWLWPYLAGLTLISYLGQFSGGREVIPFYWDLGVVAVWSLVVYYAAMVLRLPTDRVDAYARDVYPMSEDEVVAPAPRPRLPAGTSTVVAPEVDDEPTEVRPSED